MKTIHVHVYDQSLPERETESFQTVVFIGAVICCQNIGPCKALPFSPHAHGP